MKLKVAHIETGEKDKPKSKWEKITNFIIKKVENYSFDIIITYLRGLA